jgi:hypothetical protein
LLKLEPNATCGFVRATFMSKLTSVSRQAGCPCHSGEVIE